MKRTDKFRPSVINPAEFVLVSHHYLGPIGEDMQDSGVCEEMAEQAEILEAHQAERPGFTVAGHKWPGQCDCCGARYMWGSTFHTGTTNTYISIGNICAGKLSMGDPAAMKSFREQVNTYKIHQERVAAARKFAADKGITAALDLYLSNAKADERLSQYDRFPHNTLVDMCGKLVRWGSLSDAQVAFAVKLLEQIADQPRKLAEREAREANRKPIPAFIKRATVEGVIVSAKYQEGGYTSQGFYQPSAVKIVVEHADGWKVWGTAAAELTDAVREFSDKSYLSGDQEAELLKGKRVKFDCRITVSENDSKFGFFKRPTKAQLLDAPPVAA